MLFHHHAIYTRSYICNNREGFPQSSRLFVFFCDRSFLDQRLEENDHEESLCCAQLYSMQCPSSSASCMVSLLHHTADRGDKAICHSLLIGLSPSFFFFFLIEERSVAVCSRCVYSIKGMINYLSLSTYIKLESNITMRKLDHSHLIIKFGFQLSEEDNPALQFLIDTIQHNSTHHCSNEAKISYRQLLPKKVTFLYQYDGSLTTPNCTENVLWNVIEEKSYISNRQVGFIISTRTCCTSKGYKYDPVR